MGLGGLKDPQIVSSSPRAGLSAGDGEFWAPLVPTEVEPEAGDVHFTPGLS